MTSPEAPIQGIDKEFKPVYMPRHEKEQIRSHLYKLVSQGEIMYTELMKQVFGKYLPAFNSGSMIVLLSNYLSTNKDDMTYLKEIYHAADT